MQKVTPLEIPDASREIQVDSSELMEEFTFRPTLPP